MAWSAHALVGAAWDHVRAVQVPVPEIDAACLAWLATEGDVRMAHRERTCVQTRIAAARLSTAKFVLSRMAKRGGSTRWW